MKKLLLLAIGICLVLLPNLGFAEAPLVPKKIGVLELENKTQFPLAGELAADAIMVHLLQAKSCDVIEREYLNQTFIQNALKPKGVLDPALVSSVGNQLGLDYILMGSVAAAKTNTTPARWQQVKMGQMRVPQFVPGYSNSYADFEVMLVDVKTSKIVWNGNYTGTSSTADVRDAVKDGGRQTVRRIYSFIPLQGSVTKIDGNKIHINLGKENGIGPKDTFTLAKQNQAIDSKKATKLKVLEVSELSCIAMLKDTNTVIETGDVVIKSL